MITIRSKKIRAGGFTLMELLTVITIIGILASLLLTVFARVKKSSLQTQCASNLRQLGVAENLYATEHDNLYTPFFSSAIPQT